MDCVAVPLSAKSRLFGFRVAAALSALFLLPLAGATAVRAAADVELPYVDGFPEGVAVSGEGTLFVGSIKRGEIHRARPGQRTAELFVPQGRDGLMSVVGIYADDARGLLYACSSDLKLPSLTGYAAPALKAFDLSTGAPRGTWQLPNGGFCNDITVLADGTVFVTNSFRPEILVKRPGAATLDLWQTDPRFAGEGFRLNGIDHDGSGSLFVAITATGEILRIAIAADGNPGGIEKLALPAALSRPDGVKVMKDGRILVVEQSAGRVVAIDLARPSQPPTVLASGIAAPTTAYAAAKSLWVVESRLPVLWATSDKATAAVPGPVLLRHFPLQ
jgi:sugar lactone lactonase YvrE